MMTEFGACDINNYTDLGECNRVLNYADEYFQSWTDYTYAQDEKFEPTYYWNKTFSRTYPQAISGEPINITYNRDNGYFDFCYNINTNINKPTEIYYRNLSNIIVTPNLRYTLDKVKNKIYLYSKGSGIGCIKIF